MVSHAAYELVERLVEENIRLFKRQLTRKKLLKFGGTCSKNDMRRKGLYFIYKGPDHSCLSDIEEMTEVEQMDIPSDN